MSKKFTCPRRIAEGHASDDSPLVLDGSNKDEWTDRSGLVGQATGCSYCGSMPPQDFMDAVRDGKEIVPTDKPYKLYVHGNDDMRAKFYTHHLSPEESNEFYNLYVDGQMRVGYPGHFYAKLYLPGLSR